MLTASCSHPRSDLEVIEETYEASRSSQCLFVFDTTFGTDSNSPYSADVSKDKSAPSWAIVYNLHVCRGYCRCFERHAGGERGGGRRVVNCRIHGSLSTFLAKTRHDKTRQDKTRQDKTIQVRTRHDTTRHDATRHDKIRQDKTRQDKASQKVTRTFP